jgi:hypothetical protein
MEIAYSMMCQLFNFKTVPLVPNEDPEELFDQLKKKERLMLVYHH